MALGNGSLPFSDPLLFVIPRACDFFDLFVFSAYPSSCISSPRQSRHPECSWACGPPKMMKNVSVRRPLSLYRCPLLVIPTGAKRSGGICGSTDPSWICFSTERSASTDLSREQRLVARSRRTPKMLILSMPFAPFQPPKPAPGGPATVFPEAENKNR
jgi:hypothetical protein